MASSRTTSMSQTYGRRRRRWIEDVKLSAFMLQPTLCSLEEFETLHSFETGADILRRAYETACKPVYDGLRLFVLLKGASIRDSRSRDGLQAEVKAVLYDEGDTYRIVGTVNNTGVSTWRPSGPEPGAVEHRPHASPAERRLAAGFRTRRLSQLSGGSRLHFRVQRSDREGSRWRRRTLHRSGGRACHMVSPRSGAPLRVK